MYRKVKKSYSRDLLLYGLGILLLMEWLYPLPYMSNTGFIHIFMLVSIVFFLITILQLPVVLSTLFTIIIISSGMYMLFFDGSFFSFGWINIFLMDLLENMILMIEGKWDALTDMFRSFLLFVLLAIMSYLLFYWTVHARRIMFFLIFTVVYVAVIDTFTPYDATYAIIRTFVIGFLLLGLLTIYRRMEYESVASASKFLPIRLAMILVMMVAAGGILGFLSPKLEPQWDDPVPFVRTAIGMSDNEHVTGKKRIGYGSSDEQLGGGFIDDDTPVFYVATSRKNYWRGETKDFYTGKGWVTTTPEVEGPPHVYEKVELERLEAEVAFSEESTRTFDHLFYPGELVNRTSIMDIGLSFDTYSEKASTFIGESPTSLSYYHLEYALPQYSLDSLRSTSADDPEMIREYYTQLPDSLPQRVQDLAKELVVGIENRFDQAKAIESYLSSSTFKYETEDVPIPGDGEDYVDQFLFETQQGYCDNFSTSMIVMLRSIDIPVRWAKGFTQGELIESPDDNRDIYQITNGHAHSWVEVYFPEVGWVPFEPTKGFDHAVELIDHQEDIEEDDLKAVDDQVKEESELVKALAKLENSDDQSGFLDSSIYHHKLSILISLFIVVLLFIIVRNKKVVRYYTLHRFSRMNDEKTFVIAYERLLWLLQYTGHARNKGETLREYALRMDAHFYTNELGLLTNEFERIMYGGQSENASWSTQKSTWLSFIRKIES